MEPFPGQHHARQTAHHDHTVFPRRPPDGGNRTNWVNHIVHALSGFSVHAEIVGVRALGVSAILGVFVVGLIAVAVILKLFSGIPLLGWTSQVIGILLVLLFQLATTTVVMVFMMVTLRMQIPMIPMAEFDKFISDVRFIEFRSGPRDQGS